MLSSFLLPMLSLDPDKRITASNAAKHPWLYLNDENDYKVYLDQLKISEQIKNFTKKEKKLKMVMEEKEKIKIIKKIIIIII